MPETNAVIANSDYDRMERAIRYLERDFRHQPALEDVARFVGLSESHFQRLFTRWVGISPKRFIQFQTIEHAKRLLREERSVLDTTYESGLSSSGRLHDLFVTVEAVTPGEYKRRGEGVDIVWGVHDTPFGEALISATERGVCGLDFVYVDRRGRERGLVERLSERWPEAHLKEDRRMTGSLVERIFAGQDGGGARPLGVVLKGTNFQLKVWEALLRIPFGHLVTYEEVAVAIGQPKAVRAVGSAVGSNPVSFLVPCHRVIRKSGDVGQYGGGVARKRAMLGWESARRFGEAPRGEGPEGLVEPFGSRAPAARAAALSR
jgi:AraC family transcriptional regulator of adaptative response/methylated-DNA-[protein]-cysteine methyltransferase